MHHLWAQGRVVGVTPRRSWLGAGLDGLAEVDVGRSAAALDLLLLVVVVVLLLMGLAGPGGLAGDQD